jgi:hypothetical protein
MLASPCGRGGAASQLPRTLRRDEVSVPLVRRGAAPYNSTWAAKGVSHRKGVVKRINLDQKERKIKDFVCSLAADPEGSVLVMNGEPVVRVLPVVEEGVDLRKLKAAILRRRGASRQSNKEWEAADREVWER